MLIGKRMKLSPCHPQNFRSVKYIKQTNNKHDSPRERERVREQSSFTIQFNYIPCGSPTHHHTLGNDFAAHFRL